MTTADPAHGHRRRLDRVDGPLKVAGRGALPVRRQLSRHGPRRARPQHDRGRPDPRHRRRRRAGAPGRADGHHPPQRAAARPRGPETLLGPPPPPAAAGRPRAAPRAVRRGRGRRHAAAGRRRGRGAGRVELRAGRAAARRRRRARRAPARPVRLWTCERGDVEAGLAAADVVHRRRVYTTAENTNNPLGLFAHRRRMGRRHGHRARRHAVAPPTCARHVAADRSASRRRRSACSRRTSAAASAPGCGRGSTSSSTALAARGSRPPGQAGADAAADVHRRRAPPQHGPADPARGQARRRARRASTTRRCSRVAMEDDDFEPRLRWLGRCPTPARTCRDARPAAAPEHPVPRLDARAGRGAGQLRAGVGHRRARLRPRHRPAGAAAAQLRRDHPAARAALVEQGAARVLRGRRGAVRLVATATPRRRLDARRPLARRLRHGRASATRGSSSAARRG